MDNETKSDIEQDIQCACTEFEYACMDSEVTNELRKFAADGEFDDYMDKCRYLRNVVNGLIDAAHPEQWDGEAEADENGPVIVLISPYAWGKGHTLASAKRALRRAGGDVERILTAYVTADATAYVDGLGYLNYTQGKPTFKIPVERRHEDRIAKPVQLLDWE